jgi:hypothetical protein
MASLRNLASFLAERAGKKRDITFIRSMEDLLIVKRARFLANSLSKDPSKDRFYLQKFKLPLTKIDLEDECLETEDIDPKCESKAYISTDSVPIPIRYGVHPFNYVGPVGGFKGYGWTTLGTEPWMKKRDMVGGNPRYTYTSNKIYIFNKEISEIAVEGVFPDPRLLKEFQSCDGTVCWSEEQEAFIEDEIAELILTDIEQNNLRLAVPNPPIQVKTDENV